MKKKVIRGSLIGGVLLIIIVGLFLLYRYNYIPHRKYSNEHFGITAYVSDHDQDGDGIDDQTDILQSVRDYISTKPKYKSKYYATGYPDDEYGVCTDVVAFGLKGAGYNLMELVNQDVLSNPEEYAIEKPDINIDFRRVVNLRVYFERHATSLTTDLSDIEEWQGGDIVIWAHHVGIVSDMRNSKGIPFVIHNANPVQRAYEEDVLATFGEIVGHYRMSQLEYRVLIGANAEDIDEFPVSNQMVLDGEYFSADEVKLLKKRGVQQVYSYLNIGSLEEFRACYEQFQAYSLDEYENWQGEHWMNVSNLDWQEYIVEQGKSLLDKGFDGLFIDNIDVYYQYHEKMMYDGIVKILSELHAMGGKVIINGGDVFVCEYLESDMASGSIFDAINQEDVYTNYNFDSGTFEMNSVEQRNYWKEYLDSVGNQQIDIYVLEYAKEDQLKSEAYAFSRENGWICYVANNIDLK